MNEMPRFAMWLLTRCLPSATSEALVGDLLEERRAGRSVWWLWRQVWFAVAATAIADVAAEPLAMLQFAVLLMAATLAWVESTWAMYLWINHHVVFPGIDAAFASTPLHSLFFYFMEPFGGGLSVVWCAGVALAARLCARVLGGRPAGSAVASLAVVTPLALWWGVPMLRFVNYNFAAPRIAILNLLVALFVTVGMPLAACGGSLLGLAPDGDRGYEVKKSTKRC